MARNMRWTVGAGVLMGLAGGVAVAQLPERDAVVVRSAEPRDCTEATTTTDPPLSLTQVATEYFACAMQPDDSSKRSATRRPGPAWCSWNGTAMPTPKPTSCAATRPAGMPATA